MTVIRPQIRFAALLVFFIAIYAETASAQIYSRAELDAEAVRLRNAVFRIYNIGIKPSLTEAELAAVGDFEFNFPLPEPDDALMNFAATTDGSAMIMPLMSLKALEDLTTAYAWLYHKGMNLSTIDLYFTMMRYRGASDFPGGKFPRILDALGVPPDAYKTDKKVDELSLSLRNEAFAFIIAHELGHIRFKHKPIDEITASQAQADEIQSDAFALDIFTRTKTPPLGPVLFFQAQIYNLLHPVEFGGRDQGAQPSALLQTTHPLSVDRIAKMTDYVEGPLTRSRPGEAALWTDIAGKLRSMASIMEDTDTARCIIKIAKEANVSVLKPRRSVETEGIFQHCRGS